MQDANHALSVLRNRTKIANLEFDTAGQVELVIEDSLSIFLSRVSDTEIEFSSSIDALDDKISVDVMKAMLTANALGAGTGTARLALDAGTGEALVCDRVDVRLVDAAGFEARFTTFVRTAAFWATDGARDLLAAARPAVDVNSLDPAFIRL